MVTIEPITEYLKRRLREAGPAQFDVIAERTGVAVSFIRKFVYGSRENPRVQTIQPLMDYFSRVDTGEEDSPRLGVSAPAAASHTAPSATSPGDLCPDGIERRDPNRVHAFDDLDRRAPAAVGG